MRRVLIALVLIGMLQPALTRPAADVRDAPKADAGSKWMGVVSCASSGCHNSGAGRETKGSEYTTWNANDPHARAYSVLSEERAFWIARNAIPDSVLPAHEQPLCLKCHVSGYTGGKLDPVDTRFSVRDGIGCESCHGRAEKWLEPHSRPDFRGKTADEKAALGLRDTKRLRSRFAICAGCHIGDIGREVDHALIAAGHPRLNFDFSGYLAMYGKHWPKEADRGRYPDFETRAWLVGQVGGAKASLELLADRARRADGTAKDADPRWPEFSEYGCFGCHQKIGVPPRDGLRRKPVSRPGEPPWNSWHLALTATLAPRWPEARTTVDAIDRLRPLMAAWGKDPARVAFEASTAARETERWLDALDAGPQRTNPLTSAEMRNLLGLLADSKPPDWDAAAQVYLGVRALAYDLTTDRAKPEGRDSALRLLHEAARRLRRGFPDGSDSPSAFDADAAAVFHKQMGDIRKLLDN